MGGPGLLAVWLTPAVWLTLPALILAGGPDGLWVGLAAVVAPLVAVLAGVRQSRSGDGGPVPLFHVAVLFLVVAGLIWANLVVVGDLVGRLGAPRWHGIAIAAAGGLLLDTTYYARIHATFSGGDDSGFVGIGSTMTLAAQPGLAVFSAVSSSTVGVGWSSGTAAEGFNKAGTLYEVQLSSDAFATLVQSSFTFNDSAGLAGLAPNTTFYARARAFNGLGVASAFGPASSTATR